MRSRKGLSAILATALVVTLAPAVLCETAVADSIGDDTGISVVQMDAAGTSADGESDAGTDSDNATAVQSDETAGSSAADSNDSNGSDAVGDTVAAQNPSEGDADNQNTGQDAETSTNPDEENNGQDESSDETVSDSLAAPADFTAKLAAGGVQLSWSEVSGAEGYTVLRKKSGASAYTELATTDATAYADTGVKSGTTYVYSVKASAGGAAGEDATAQTLFVLLPATVTAVDHTSASTVKITWGKVSGASGYYVYRKESGGSWKKVKTATSTSWSDSSLKNGKQYYYTIKTYSSSKGVTSARDDGVLVRKFSNPSLTSAANASGGVKVTWGKVSGATGYYVYRKTSGGKWKKIGSSTSTSYTDNSSLKSGTVYYYTVRAYQKGSGFTNRSWYSKSGVSERRLSIPGLKSAANVSSGVKVTWGKVSGAKKYYVYRKKSGSGSWTKIKTTTSTSYTDKSSLKSGTKYVYTVRAVNGSDKSYYKTAGIAVTRLSIPSLKSAKKTSKGIKVTWKKVTGATGYVVYRKTSSGWKRIKTTSSTSYTDTTTTNKKTLYTVRAYKGSDKSWYKSAGISVNTTTVVITKTGSKYHTSDCPSLARSKKLTKMTRQKAESKGYKACKNCDP